MDRQSQKSFTDFFIHNPVFSWVLNIIIILLGVTAFFQLTLRQYPAIEDSKLTVIVEKVAGSIKTIENQVTKPLEDAFASLQGLTRMKSVTERGKISIYMNFANRSTDAAAADAREAQGRVELPECQVEIFKGNTDGDSVMQLVFTGENISLNELYEFAHNNLKSQFESVTGVATVEISGGSGFQMKIMLDPVRMESYKITASEIKQAIQGNNFLMPVGRIRESQRDFSLTAQFSPKTAKDFQEIVISKDNKRLVKLGDVATITFEARDERQKIMYNGRNAIALDIKPQSNASPVEISREVTSKIQDIKGSLPKGSRIDVFSDESTMVKASIYKVYQSFFEALVLVLIVIYFFLRSFKASLIPLITIPISVIGTFFIMYVLGFSINVLSLLSLVLAIGLVVDDAIVVLENIYRYLEQGKKPLQAAIEGTREIRFSVIAMTITLAVVYAPIAIAPGKVGKVFKEFALTLAGAVILSGVTALTLSPMMCARLLDKPHHYVEGSGNMLTRFFGAIERFLVRLDKQYRNSVVIALRYKIFVLGGAFLFSVWVSMWAAFHLKKEVSPSADLGMVYVRMTSMPEKNLSYVHNRGMAVDKALTKYPEVVDSRLLFIERGESIAYVSLLPWDKRSEPCEDFVERLHNDLHIRGLEITPNCQSTSIISTPDPTVLRFMVTANDDSDNVFKVAKQIRKKLQKTPGIRYVQPVGYETETQYLIRINQERTNELGINPQDVATTLDFLLSGIEVGKVDLKQKNYPVNMMVQKTYQASMDGIRSLFVQGQNKRSNVLVPLREILSFEEVKGESIIDHYMKKQSVEVIAYMEPYMSNVETFLSLKKEAEDTLPAGYSLEPGLALFEYFKEQGSIYMVFGLALSFIFLVMAAQFESFRAPFIIILSVPMALSSALISLFFLKGGSLNVYSQIGLVTLIGLITKHGILLVDFANKKCEEGASVENAILEACQLRLRPIIMTTLAMVFGSVPLMMAKGAGAEGSRQIGAVIVGGMSLGTVFTLFVVPIMYTLIMRSFYENRRISL